MKQVLDQTSSGNFGGNSGFLYMTLPGLPFGGVGEALPFLAVQLPTPSPLAQICKSFHSLFNSKPLKASVPCLLNAL